MQITGNCENYSLIKTRKAGIILALLFFIMIFLTENAKALSLFSSSEKIKSNIEFLDGSIKKGEIIEYIDERESQSTKNVRNILINMDEKEWGVPFISLFRISPWQIDRIVYASNTEVECFSMGKNADDLPEPVNWYLRLDNNNFWTGAKKSHTSADWHYIPQAMWIWSSTNWNQINGETVLFRKTFDVPQEFKITKSVITVTADSRIDAIYMNGIKICGKKDQLIGKIVEFDISNAVENGKNILGIKATNAYEPHINFGSIAFSISIDGLYMQSIPKELQLQPDAVIFLKNNDLIKGLVTGITTRAITVKTIYGTIEMNPDWVKEILYAHETSKDFPENANKDKTFFWEIPRNTITPKESVLLKDGKVIEGEIENLSDNNLKIQPLLGTETIIPVAEIASVFPNSAANLEQPIYDLSQTIIPAQFKMINGDSLTGIIDNINNRKVVFSTPYSNNISTDFTDIESITFPYNTILNEKLKITPGKLNTIGFFGELGTTANDPDSVFMNSSRAIEMMGLKPLSINPQQIVDASYFSPSRFSMIINLDEYEQFYQSIKDPDDGLTALKKYFSGGGSVSSFATGVPFAYGSIFKGNKWYKTKFNDEYNTFLKMNIIMPGEKTASPAKTFELPENTGAALFFKLNKENLPEYLKMLPETIQFPLSDDTKFRPVIPVENLTDDQKFIPLYSLKDNAGNTYGNACAIVIFKDAQNKVNNFSFYASHLLIQSKYKEVPFVYFILPQLISFENSIRK